MKLKWFQIAEKIAKHSNHPQHRMGAVIVRKNKILGLGMNQCKTHPKSPNPYHMIHAELSAILNSRQEDLTGAEIYICRIRKGGDFGLSRPCKDCLRLLKLNGIDLTHYTCYNGIYETISWKNISKSSNIRGNFRNKK